MIALSLAQFRSITLTLIVVVLMHVVLVSPAEFVMYFRQRLKRLNDVEDDEYNLLAAVSNTLQAIYSNFTACNDGFKSASIGLCGLINV